MNAGENTLKTNTKENLAKVQEARRKNLRDLIRAHDDHTGRGGVTVVAKRLGYEWTGFISHLLHGRRQMYEPMARQIERVFLLPENSMDEYPLPARGPIGEKNRLLVVLAEAATRAGVTLAPDKIEAAIRLMQAAERADAEYADTVVSLMK